MSTSHTHTIGLTMGPLVADDDEDNDICPVCDGECTCDNRPVSLIAHSTNHFNSPSTSAHHLPIPVSSKPNLPSLKIKLTVPPSMLGKRRTHPSSSNRLKHTGETTYVVEAGGEVPPSPFSPIASGSHVHSVKRKGRPPKSTVAACDVAVRPARAGGTLSSITPSSTSHLIGRNTTTLLGKQKHRPTARSLPTKLKGKGTTVKKAAPKRRRLVSSSESSDPSDEDDEFGFDGDTQSGQFPTFVSASIMSSTSSNESDAASLSLSGFDSDSSIEAEEENFIVHEEGRTHEKARIRRELLGEEGPKKRDPHNDWVIRPRKHSVGPEEVEMEVDSDATEEDDDEEEDEEDDDDEEVDGRGTGAGYVGVATGWSDDEESSFDADLFFANLSDSGSSDDSSMSDDDGAGDDGDQSDLDAASYGSASITSLPPRVREDLPFEVTEGWDGQIVFTNGLTEGQGILEMDFEVNAAQFVAETSVPPSQESDVEMSTSEPDEGGYEEDGDGGEGDTTDEELVGEDDLPNERAMRLFTLPFSISAINPMSTMSPTVSPGPRSRRPFGSQGQPNSPKPADILAGKVFWDSDDRGDFEDSRSKSCSLSSRGVPRTGKFECVHEIRKAVIDDSHKDIPSPHPRFRGRGRVVSRMGRRDSVKSVFCKHASSSRTSSVSASVRSPFQSDDIPPTSPDIPPAEPIDLNDVLEASFLDPDPFDQRGSALSPTSEDESHTSSNPNRWDHIPVSAFRQNQESGSLTDTTTPGWASDSPAPNTDYESMMKSSPLSLLWPNKTFKSSKRNQNMGVVVSPLVMPVRDGDRTPTNIPNYLPPPQQNHNHSHKGRKELRRERKLKRKNYGSSHHPHQNHHHHFHQHHPNSKTRSSSSSQRSNFFGSSSIPPLNI